MNQGKLEVVKQEMARVNINILGIKELKWTGIGEFNSIYFGVVLFRINFSTYDRKLKLIVTKMHKIFILEFNSLCSGLKRRKKAKGEEGSRGC